MSKYGAGTSVNMTRISGNQTKKDQGTSFYDPTAAFTQLGEAIPSTKSNPNVYTRSKPGVAMVKLEQHQGDLGTKGTSKKATLFEHGDSPMFGALLKPGITEDHFISRNPLELSHNVSNIPFTPVENSHWQSFIKDFPDLN